MKGQYFSFDAIIGASIFILTLVAILSYWYGVSSSIEQQQSSLAKEATRIADILYSPSTVPYGITLNWSDKHINATKVEELCRYGGDPAIMLGSEYAVAIDFKTREDAIPYCPWGAAPYSNEVYRVRRVGSYLFDDGTTELGYVDVYVYNAYNQP
jgi:hypothetical protein